MSSKTKLKRDVTRYTNTCKHCDLQTISKKLTAMTGVTSDRQSEVAGESRRIEESVKLSLK